MFHLFNVFPLYQTGKSIIILSWCSDTAVCEHCYKGYLCIKSVDEQLIFFKGPAHHSQNPLHWRHQSPFWMPFSTTIVNRKHCRALKSHTLRLDYRFFKCILIRIIYFRFASKAKDKILMLCIISSASIPAAEMCWKVSCGFVRFWFSSYLCCHWWMDDAKLLMRANILCCWHSDSWWLVETLHRLL